MTFLAFVGLLAESFLYFLVNYLVKIGPFALAFFQAMLVGMSALVSCTPFLLV
jgi:hypothetical protein